MFAAAVPHEQGDGRQGDAKVGGNSQGSESLDPEANFHGYIPYEPITSSWRDIQFVAKKRDEEVGRQGTPGHTRHGQSGVLGQRRTNEEHGNSHQEEERNHVGFPKSSRKEKPRTDPKTREIFGKPQQHPGADGEGIQVNVEKRPLKEVIEKAKNTSWLKKAKENFKNKYFAKSTAASKNSKRRKIVEILGKSPPYEVEDFATLGAVLDAAGMKAGEQYVQEAKSLRVEEGWTWDLRLEAHLNSCKRALKRDKGPERRALEVRLESLTPKKLDEKNKTKVGPKWPAWSYAWAVTWMLRAIEAAEVLTEHVQEDGQQKLIRLFIPKSKMDQKGQGTKRTLKCCGKKRCSRFCPWALWQKVKTEASWDKGGKLFPGADGQDYTKLQMVTAWIQHIDKGMSGHSARRSGAMMYARTGFSLPEISFLGRWRSSAVLRYVEEALTEIPANANQSHDGEPLRKSRKKETDLNKGATEEEAIDVDSEVPVPQNVIDLEPKVQEELQQTQQTVASTTKEENHKTMWVISTSRGRKTSHAVGQAGWGLTLEDWTTICGWHFARKNVKVQITTQEKAVKFPMCMKCKKGQEARDGVNRAREWAHSISDAVEVKPTGTAAAPGWQLKQLPPAFQK